MSGVVYTSQVHFRNRFGQFIRECEIAGEKTVEKTVTQGATLAAKFSPKKTGRLAASVQPFMLTRTSGVWGSNAPYGAAQEYGAKPHDITAYVTFFWDKVGRMWMHPDTYQRFTGYPGADPIKHPGNPATHFMQRSYAVMRARMAQIAKSTYPG